MEPGQGFMNMKGLLIIAAVAAGAYFLFFRNSGGSAAAPTSTGGSGTITTGNTRVDSGAVTVNVSQGAAGGDSDGGGQPTPPGSTQIPGHYTIQSTGKETLTQIASRYHTTASDIIKFTEAHKTHVSPTEKRFFGHPTGKVPRGIILWVPEPQVYGNGQSGQTVNPGGPNIPATS